MTETGTRPEEGIIGPVTKVVHCMQSPYDIYIGRPSVWGNPFMIGRDGSREEVIRRYREWVLNQPGFVRKIREELRGKVLGCWCRSLKNPQACHGDVLAEMANGSDRSAQTGDKMTGGHP